MSFSKTEYFHTRAGGPQVLLNNALSPWPQHRADAAVVFSAGSVDRPRIVHHVGSRLALRDEPKAEDGERDDYDGQSRAVGCGSPPRTYNITFIILSIS
jgi:hypothetical protein